MEMSKPIFLSRSSAFLPCWMIPNFLFTLMEVDNSFLRKKNNPLKINANKKIKINVFKDMNKMFENFIHRNCEIKKTLFLSISSLFIFKKKQIKFLEDNLINYFPSRLPYDTGRGGFSWHIMREDKILNNNFHIIDESINTGPIIFEDSKIFPSNCKIPLDYESYNWAEMNIFYEKFIKKLINEEKFFLCKQNKNLGRHNPSLNTLQHGFINWDMNSYDLYPSKWKESFELQQLREKSQLEGNKSMATDQFLCTRCWKRECTYYEMQTRSADEPMTIFITCVNCGKHWRQ
jgi:folate-dependent phosphoribosylglycinamide formyltransferase PurN